MTAGWLMYDVIVVALFAVAAWAVEALCRQVGRPARWAWLVAAAAAVALIARSALVAGPSTVGALLANASSATAPTGVAADWTIMAAVRDAVALTGTAIASIAAGAARLIPAWAVAVAAALWLGASVAAIVVLALVHLRIRRARRAWPEADLHGDRVRIAPDVGPAVVGVLRPEIVVPRWLLGCTTEEQRLVLAHEREHLRGRDHLLLGVGSLVVALVPWHPAVWWMLARLRLAIELDCDARVLRRGVRAKDYGTVLIDLAGRCSGFRVGATALADEGSHLERRLLAMNANRIRRPFLRAGLLGAAALALLAACEAKVPTAAEIDGMDVASAQRLATKVQMLRSPYGDSTLFVVDGHAVDALTANSLAPNQIATVNVSKGKTAGDAAIIRITTNGAVRQDAGTMKLRTSSPDAAPLVLLDGVPSDIATIKALDRNSIVTIDVIKGEQAKQMSSDPAAANGIIKVVTKK